MSAQLDTKLVYHVHPTRDLEEHDLDGFECHCHPRIQEEEHGYVVIHNAFDKRELLER